MPTPTTMKPKLSSIVNSFQIKKKKKSCCFLQLPGGQLLGENEVPRRYQITLKGRKDNKTTFVFLQTYHRNGLFVCALFLFYTMFIWKSLIAFNIQKISKALLTVTFLTELPFLTTSVEQHLCSLPMAPYKHRADPRENQGPTNHGSQVRPDFWVT